nr:polyprotein [Iflaviridae sp.]
MDCNRVVESRPQTAKGQLYKQVPTVDKAYQTAVRELFKNTSKKNAISGLLAQRRVLQNKARIVSSLPEDLVGVYGFSSHAEADSYYTIELLKIKFSINYRLAMSTSKVDKILYYYFVNNKVDKLPWWREEISSNKKYVDFMVGKYWEMRKHFLVNKEIAEVSYLKHVSCSQIPSWEHDAPFEMAFNQSVVERSERSNIYSYLEEEELPEQILADSFFLGRDYYEASLNWEERQQCRAKHCKNFSTAQLRDGTTVYQETTVPIPIDLVGKLRDTIRAFGESRVAGSLFNTYCRATSVVYSSITIVRAWYALNDIVEGGMDCIEMQDLSREEAIEAVPESADAVDTDASLVADQSQNVTLTVARTEDSEQASEDQCKIDWTLLTSSDIKGSFKELSERWFDVGSFNWTTSDSQNKSLKIVALPRAIITKSDDYQPCAFPNALPFLIHRYWRGDLEIKIQVNSNRFQIGQLQCAWLYNVDYDNASYIRTNIYSLSQAHHVVINASSSNEVTLYIPYRNYAPMLHTKSRTDMPEAMVMGKLYITVLYPLSVGASGPDSCSGHIFIRCLNNQFTGMLYGDIDVPKVACTPEMDIVRDVVGIASRLVEPNRDLPSDARAPMYIVPTASHSWSAGTNVGHPIHPLRLDLKAQTQHPDFGTDEMTVDYVKRIYGLVKTVEWSNSNPEGYLLFHCDAAPLWDVGLYSKYLDSDGSTLDAYYMPPVAVLSSMFNYWRGSMEFKIDFIASQFHTGRVLIAYVPGATSQTPMTLQRAKASPHMVFTLQEQQEVTYVVPYISNKPYCKRLYTGNYKDESALAPSHIYIYVLNKLIPMQSVVDKIGLNIYVRGGVDFEVSVPIQPCIGLGYNRTVMLPTNDYVHALVGYSPYYVGTYYGFFNSGYLCLRYGTTSGQISYFENGYAKAAEKSNKKYWYYYKMTDTSAAPQYENDGSMHYTEYGFLVPDTNKSYIMGIVKSEDEARLACAYMLGGGEYAGLAQHFIKVTSTTNNTYSTGNPSWLPVMVRKQTDDEPFELVNTEGRTDTDAIVVTGTTLGSTMGGQLLFGEKFVDLKDLARRYQAYCGFIVELGTLQRRAGQCSVIIPILPQGLDLQLGSKTSIFEIANRCRDGHIPIICSAYRYYRGGLRFRLLCPIDQNFVMWIQHRPDRRLRATGVTPCSTIHTAESFINHTYGTYIQFTQVNGIVEFEIPYYQNGMFGLLQRPNLVRTEESQFYSLGEVAIGFDMALKPKDLPDVSKAQFALYYSFADDTRCYTFQGFPPCILLDEIAPINIKDKVDATPEMGVVVDADPEMGLADFFKGKANEVKEELMADVKTEIADVVTEKVCKIEDALKKHLTESGVSSFGFLDSSIVRNILTNVVHTVLNPTLKTAAWAVVSFLLDIRVLAKECITQCMQYVMVILQEFKIGNTEEAKSGTEPRDPDIIQCEKNSGANDDISDSTKNACLGLITLIWTGLCSLASLKCMPKKDLAGWTKFLVQDMKGVFQGGNALFQFIRNILSVMDDILIKITGYIVPGSKYAKELLDSYPIIQAWAKEVSELIDPSVKINIPYYASLQDRVHLAYSRGQVLMCKDILDKPAACVTTVQKLFDKIHKLKEELVSQGIDASIRKQPFTIYMHGEPGIGKSETMDAICAALLQATHTRITTTMSCVINPVSEFWSNCDRQPVLVVDDLFNIRSGELLDRQIALLFSVVSPVVLNPPMAHLEDKKMRYNPEIFFINSNESFPRFPNVTMSAIYRRRDELIEAVLWTEKFATENKMKFVPVPGCDHCTKGAPINTVDVSYLADYHHLRFRFSNDVTNPTCTYSNWMTYDLMLKRLVVSYKKNRERETARFMKRVNTLNTLRDNCILDETDMGFMDKANAVLAAQRRYIYDIQNSSLWNEVKTCYANGVSGLSECIDVMKRYVPTTPWIQSESMRLKVQAQVHNNPFEDDSGDEVVFTRKEAGDFEDVTDTCGLHYNMTYEQYLEALDRGATSTIGGTQEDLILQELQRMHEDGVINGRMFTQGVNVLMDCTIADDDTTLDFFKVHSALIRELLETTTYASRSWECIVEGVMAYTVKVKRSDCQHLVHPLDEMEFVMSDPHTPPTNTLNYRGADILAPCCGVCIHNSVLFKYAYWRCWINTSYIRRGYYRNKVFRRLPSFFSCVNPLVLPPLNSWYNQIKDWLQRLYNQYIKGPLRTIIDFIKDYKEILIMMGIGLAMFGPSTYAILKTTSVYNKAMDEVKTGIATGDVTVIKYGSSDYDIWLKDGYVANFTGESQTYAPTGVKPQVIKPPVVTTKESAPPQCAVARQRIRDNMYIITAVFDQKKLEVTCLMLRLRELLVIRHYIEEFNALPPHTQFYGRFAKDKTTDQHPYGLQLSWKDFKIDWYKSYHSSGAYASNIGIVYLPPQVQECKSLVPFIAPAERHGYSDGNCCLVTPTEVYVGLRTTKFDSKAHVINSSCVTSAVVLQEVYRYPIHGKGMCGSVLMSNNLETPILGLHVAGIDSDNIGISEILVQEMFKESAEKIEQAPYVSFVLPKLADEELAKIQFDTLLDPVGCVDGAHAHSQSSQTQYIPSVVHGVLPVTTEPAPLKKNDSRLPPDSAPYKRGVENMGLPPLDFSTEDVQEACADLQLVILRTVLPVRPVVNVVPLEHAICGIPNLDGYEPLAWNTSPGYPLKSMSVSPGKKWLFNLEETENGYKLLSMHAELQRILTLEYNLRLRKIKPFTLFTDCLKDSCIDKNKCCIPGKTRIFSISPVQFTIAFKQYFGDFMAGYQKARFRAEHAIGISVDGPQWGHLVNTLMARGPHVVVGDYKNFGPSLMVKVVEAVFNIILEWYRVYDNNEENMVIRRVMVYEIISAYHLCGNVVYTAPCGIPSGSPITAPLNCMVNSIYLRIAWKYCTNLSFHDMRVHTAIITYGDDVIMSVSEEVKEIFNTATIGKFLGKYKITFTDVNKVGEVIPYRLLRDATFLKRSFRQHPTRAGEWLAPIDEISIQSCVNWIHKKGNHNLNSLENGKQAAMLAFGRGEEYFNALVTKLTLAFGQRGLEFSIPSWKDYDRMHFSML